MLNLIYQLKSASDLKALSKKSDIPLDRLKSLVEEISEATMSEVQKLSDAMKMSIEFLTSENKKYEDLNLLFRKSIKDKKDVELASRFSHLVGNSFEIMSEQSIDYSLLRSMMSMRENTYENAFRLANQFRYTIGDEIGLSPMVNLPQIVAEKLNCILYVVELGRHIEGASAVVEGIPFIFLSPRFKPRMLFTLAHELGHILNHHGLEQDFALYDSDVNSISRSTNLDESFANAFASNLLLPERGVGVALKKIGEIFKIENQVLGDVEILYLSRIYGVSFEVAALRCEDLTLLPKGGARALYEHIKANHVNPEQRAKKLNLPERPDVTFPKVSPNLTKLAVEKIRKGSISLGKASEILSMPISQIMRENI